MVPVVFLPPALRYLKKLRDENLKALYRQAVGRIRENPYIGRTKVGDLSGVYCCDIYYNKTNYELAYRIELSENDIAVVIIMAGTRENFYEALKRYMKS